MWNPDDIEIDIDDEWTEGSIVTAKITTPAGVLEIIAEVSIWEGRLLRLDTVHIQGAEPHRVGLTFM
jgi:hypothetical protein